MKRTLRAAFIGLLCFSLFALFALRAKAVP